ncbi:hypothetical protein NL676_008289 [Syzygium grande]|nr:hypothetical protein NL676_008289 [Syzygium grande]
MKPIQSPHTQSGRKTDARHGSISKNLDIVLEPLHLGGQRAGRKRGEAAEIEYHWARGSAGRAGRLVVMSEA